MVEEIFFLAVNKRVTALKILFEVLARWMQLPSHNDFKKGIVREFTGKINKEKPK